MTQRNAISGFFLFSLSAVACSGTPGAGAEQTPAGGGKADETNGFSAYDEQPRWCGEVEGTCLRRLGGLTPLNVDFSSGDARDQGVIASCASHSFIGMLETQLAVERGIRVDLSERYQLYANFMSSGNMGTDPEVIVRFPEITGAFGVMPEQAYPYDEVLANAHRFSQDLAQGIEEGEAETIDAAVSLTEPDSQERFEVLTAASALGPLPAPGGHPISLPVAAELEEGAIVPELEVVDADGTGRIVPCFAREARDDAFTVTPQEFLAACFDHEPADYFACPADVPEFIQDKDDCATLRANADAWERTLAERTEPLAATLRALDEHEAVLIGVDTPLQLQTKAAAMWTSQSFQGSGHAVTAVGYVTGVQLQDPAEQDVGLLMPPSIFDALAERTEPGYAERFEEALTSEDPDRIAQVRASSTLGEQVIGEGGLILFRNSWGSQLGETSIGVEGYQSMSFDYFLSRLMLVESRDESGLESCASAVGHSAPFFSEVPDRLRTLAWDTLKSRLLTGIATSGGDLEEARALFETCQADD